MDKGTRGAIERDLREAFELAVLYVSHMAKSSPQHKDLLQHTEQELTDANIDLAIKNSLKRTYEIQRPNERVGLASGGTLIYGDKEMLAGFFQDIDQERYKAAKRVLTLYNPKLN